MLEILAHFCHFSKIKFLTGEIIRVALVLPDVSEISVKRIGVVPESVVKSKKGTVVVKNRPYLISLKMLLIQIF